MVATASSKDESMPLLEPEQNKSTYMGILRVVFLGSLMIGCSAALINFNKFLISGSFPYPTHLVLCHMGSGSILSSLSLFLVPSLFPSLQDEAKRAQITAKFILGRVLPIACFFGTSLVLSNVAYFYASVSFLQMMKEANVILVYSFSLFLGLEVFRCQNVVVLVFILFCTTMTITGELNFSLKGFIVQGACQVFESSRLVLQSILLSGPMKLDALTYNLFVMPLCFCALAVLLGINSLNPALFGEDLMTPAWSDFQANMYLLLPNFALAFMLNITIALFIKHSSALSMVMASLLKDLFVLLVSVSIMGESITPIQQIFFSLQLCGIFTWSMMKTFPDYFKNGLLPGFVGLAFGKSV